MIPRTSDVMRKQFWFHALLKKNEMGRLSMDKKQMIKLFILLQRYWKSRFFKRNNAKYSIFVIIIMH